MRLVGTVKPIQSQGKTFVFIAAEDGSGDFFGHVNEFSSPDLMKPGQKVSFFPAPTHRGPAAFKIEAA